MGWDGMGWYDMVNSQQLCWWTPYIWIHTLPPVPHPNNNKGGWILKWLPFFHDCAHFSLGELNTRLVVNLSSPNQGHLWPLSLSIWELVWPSYLLWKWRLFLCSLNGDIGPIWVLKWLPHFHDRAHVSLGEFETTRLVVNLSNPNQGRLEPLSSSIWELLWPSYLLSKWNLIILMLIKQWFRSNPPPPPIMLVVGPRMVIHNKGGRVSING